MKLSGYDSPVERVVRQDLVLSELCMEKEWKVYRRFSDIGFLGDPIRRAELIEMRNLVESPTCPVDLMVMYSVFAVRGDSKMNEDLFLENVKGIGEIYFHKQKLWMDYDRLRFFLRGPQFVRMPLKKEKPVRLIKRERA
ncbi:hypothetical protein [Halobacillus salinus]|uniref:Uncharacterized protein n=1 Tax=Halobacillus salinus TaxID=192814 RepID=A0A4Z0H074_9BACI|nr:hypothetical protein [Halobacillus salinus]TGB02433.1 hypothetical protein E4663_13930 [Halobacillus salinus]